MKIIAQSPGRINIIGEHTDYNNGFVLPAAIDKVTIVELEKNGTPSTCNFTAKNVDETFQFDLTDFQPLESGWQNYIMGVIAELQKLGAVFTGFNCSFEGNVPIGSGMSSSAALECSLAYGLNELFDLGFDKWQLIEASQMAEHNFVGIKCGIMDQFASVMGKKNHVMRLDCQSLEFEYFPFDLGDYQLLLLNSNVSHQLADSEYNKRREESGIGISILQRQFPTVQSLRDVTFDMLVTVKSEMTDIVYRRCKHVISESERVLQATQALLDRDFQQLGNLIYQSHHSLQYDYEVSCPELDYLSDWTRDKSYVLGSRMMGGGFGGCTINIVEKNKVNQLIEAISKDYKKQFGIDVTPYEVSIEDGAKVIK